VAAKHYRHDLDYLEIHGISGNRNNAMEISRERALKFADLLQNVRLVSTRDTAEAIPLKYLECYGTGNLIYLDTNPDRVDLRLFFTDHDKKTDSEVR
jgi:hypothetical protein